MPKANPMLIIEPAQQSLDEGSRPAWCGVSAASAFHVLAIRCDRELNGGVDA